MPTLHNYDCDVTGADADASTKLLQVVEDAFTGAIVRGRNLGLDSIAIEELAKPKMDRANLLNGGTTSPSAAVEAARLYGECVSIARDNNFNYLETDAISRSAQLISSVEAPKRDVLRRRASDLFLELSDSCAKRRDRKMEAISKTNGALCLLEMSSPTEADLLRAKALCTKTLSMRDRGSVDYAYSALNLALAERKCLRFASDAEKDLSLGRILLFLKRAKRVFSKSTESPKNWREVQHQNVIELLQDWLRYKLRQEAENIYSRCLPPNTTLHHDLGISASQFAQSVRTNHLVFGFDEPPEWLPDESAIVESAIASIEAFWPELNAATSYLDKSPGNHDGLELAVFELQSLLVPYQERPRPPVDALDRIWDRGQYERFFNAAVSIGPWDEVESEVGATSAGRLCGRIFESLVFFRKTWSSEDIEQALVNNPMVFRLAACELAQLGQWRDAFRLLEASRGLKSSKTISSDPTRYESSIDSFTWVHVTHSPSATYVIARSSSGYTGKSFSKLSGKTLTAEFMNFARGGVLISGSSDRAAATASAERIAALLTEVASWIDLNSGADVVLIPSGFFQGFPLWAVGTLQEKTQNKLKRIWSVPSRAVAYELETRRDTPHSAQFSVSVENAFDVAGLAPLGWSKHEASMIKRLLPNTWSIDSHDATKESVLASMRNSEIVHYTGHSKSQFDPLLSSLLTHGHSVTVSDLLSANNSSSLAIFGSCESGLARNDDEMLSVQSAAFYSGVGFTVGTTWAIRDPAGFAFAHAFYKALSSTNSCARGFITAEDAQLCYASAVRWLMTASVYEANSVLTRHGAPLLSGPEASLAFEFYDWAAFVPIGVDLECARQGVSSPV